MISSSSSAATNAHVILVMEKWPKNPLRLDGEIYGKIECHYYLLVDIKPSSAKLKRPK